MTQQELQKTIERIEKMEWCFDTVSAALEKDPTAARSSPLCHALVRALLRYYEGAVWRADYAADEAGLLPATLKRGVLSEDGVYNFLTEWEE